MSRARTHGSSVSNVSSGDQCCPPSPHAYETTLRFEPPLASFFLCALDRSWRSRAVSGAQAIARFGSRYTHCGVHVGYGRIVHADVRAGRVVEEDITERYGDREVLWSDAPIQRELAGFGSFSYRDAEPDLRERVTDAARALIDSPYSRLSFAALAADEWRLPGRERLKARIDFRGEVWCSALVAAAYRMAGIDLWPGRRVGDVTPADLHRLDETWLRHRVADLESRVAEIERRMA